jgi:hypothetical protein
VRVDSLAGLPAEPLHSIASSHASARAVQALYLIRDWAKESVKHYQLLLIRSGATQEFTNLKHFNK